jgi:class 3 adenylate cyclase/predicted ATPase
MQCVQCQHENRDGLKFCNQCGTSLSGRCAQCGFANKSGSKFCGECGKPLIATTSASVSGQAIQQDAALDSRFYALIPDIVGLLRGEGRVTYRRLKHAFDLDDALLSEICEELRLRRHAIDEEGKVLVWTGESQFTSFTTAVAPSQPAPVETTTVPPAVIPLVPPLVPATDTQTNGPPAAREDSPIETSSLESMTVSEPAHSAPEAERRQLTVMFCDLVGSTDLSRRLDPEELREVVRAYQETAAEVIERYEGHIAQYLGDGLLIYFGFPAAHEDDAQRAVYTGLGITEALGLLNTSLKADYDVELSVRVGIHTGPVVVGEMGGGGRHENLALGETPNIAARLEGLAQSNTAVMSPVTAQLVQRSFRLAELGLHDLKGIAEPMMLYTVLGPYKTEGVDEGVVRGGFDALVGRDEEIGLLLRRWEQSKEGLGQVVLLSGEAGIGKSSLVDGLRAHVGQEGLTRIAFRCSPYHTNSALYPLIEQVQRALEWQSGDTADVQLAKLEQGLESTSLALEEAVPLLASLLALPLPEGRYPALNLSPQQQRQQTQDVLVAWLLEEAEPHPVLAVWEDLHWADPSTLETLKLIVEQTPTVAMLHVLTYRPTFEPPWPVRSHLTPMVLNRLERPQVETLIDRLTGDKALPQEVVQHIVGKTDGVPLYVEELSKMLLESGLLREEDEQYVLTGPLSTVVIPDTLQDSLMARLDQFSTGKEVAQLGAVLGREFGYEMLQAISTQDEETLQGGLAQLVKAELLYQRGRPPQARYIFKHALIQDAAYASLLRSTRQRVHRQIAQVLERSFPELVQTQPELVAHHYTEAGQDEAAIHYWQQAAQWARQRSAYVEAISHSRQGLLLLGNLPETPERNKRELDIQLILGSSFVTNQGPGASEVVTAFERARELSHQLGDVSQLVPILRGLWNSYTSRGAVTTGLEFAEEALRVAEHDTLPMSLIAAHRMLGTSLLLLGNFVEARRHLDNVMAHYDLNYHDAYIIQLGGAGTDPGVGGLALLQLVLWYLGYPDQAHQRCVEGLDLSSKLSHPYSCGYALWAAALLHRLCRAPHAAQEYAESAIGLSSAHNFPHWEVRSLFQQGWALAEVGQVEAGLLQIEQATEKRQSAGWMTGEEYCARAEVFLKKRDITAALTALAELQELAATSGGDWFEAEGARLKGECLLMQSAERSDEAESCFHQALAVARSQQAKSWELRAAMSLSRLWQQQGKHSEARDLLATVYEWFTEGFDTADLQEAKQLLDDLGTEIDLPMS